MIGMGDVVEAGRTVGADTSAVVDSVVHHVVVVSGAVVAPAVPIAPVVAPSILASSASRSSALMVGVSRSPPVLVDSFSIKLSSSFNIDVSSTVSSATFGFITS